MKTYQIPQTDLVTSRLAYGSMRMGGSWDRVPPTPEIIRHADTLLHAAVEQGFTLIDLADIYARGKSDMVVGEVLRNNPSLRDKILLQAKTGIILADEIQPGSIPHFDFSYANITHKVENSLKRLHTDRVELLLLHRPDPLVEPEEVARAFDDLHNSGKVLHFGVSNHTPMQIELLKKFVNQPLVVNQIELNVMHNGLINDGIVANSARASYSGAQDTLDYCRLHDILIQAWSPVAGGKILDPPDDAPDNVRRIAAALTSLAQQYDTSPTAIALAWLLRHPSGIQPIIGTMNVDRIAESAVADSIELSREDWYHLLAAANGVGIP